MVVVVIGVVVRIDFVLYAVKEVIGEAVVVHAKINSSLHHL